MSPGTWDVIASHAGFKAAEQDAVPVSVNSTVRVDLRLAPGDATEMVTVTSQRTLLQTDRADVSASIEAKQVEDLPLGNNCNPQALQSLLPGVSAPLYTHTSFANPQNSQSFSVNGQAVFASTLAYRNGDFSSSPTKVYDPATGASNGSGRTQFATGGVANVLPQSRIDPISAAMLALVPQPNVPGNDTVVNNEQTKTNFDDDTTSVDLKLDHHFHSDSLSYRYSYHSSAGVALSSQL